MERRTMAWLAGGGKRLKGAGCAGLCGALRVVLWAFGFFGEQKGFEVGAEGGVVLGRDRIKFARFEKLGDFLRLCAADIFRAPETADGIAVVGHAGLQIVEPAVLAEKDEGSLVGAAGVVVVDPVGGEKDIDAFGSEGSAGKAECAFEVTLAAESSRKDSGGRLFGGKGPAEDVELLGKAVVFGDCAGFGVAREVYASKKVEAEFCAVGKPCEGDVQVPRVVVGVAVVNVEIFAIDGGLQSRIGPLRVEDGEQGSAGQGHAVRCAGEPEIFFRRLDPEPFGPCGSGFRALVGVQRLGAQRGRKLGADVFEGFDGFNCGFWQKPGGSRGLCGRFVAKVEGGNRIEFVILLAAHAAAPCAVAVLYRRPDGRFVRRADSGQIRLADGLRRGILRRVALLRSLP